METRLAEVYSRWSFFKGHIGSIDGSVFDRDKLCYVVSSAI